MKSTATLTPTRQDYRIPTEGGNQLLVKLMYPRPPMEPQRVVFMVPLVGAGAGQPILTFRSFARRGAVMISFEYRAHPGSTGMFELDKTLVDTHHALLWALEFANNLGLPLHGFATCYGAIPLFAQFRNGGHGRVLKSVNTVCGLYRLDQILRFGDFAPILSRHLGEELTTADLLAGISTQRFQWDGDEFRNAVLEYLTGLFPPLRIGRDYFEQLQYDRVNIPQTLRQLSQARYLDGVTVPPEIPCSVFVGRNDDMLATDTDEGRAAYKQSVLSLIPHATVFETEIDHFGRGVEHDSGMEVLNDFMVQSEKSAVPRPHFDHMARIRGIPR